jgi:hypothetical protein
MKEQFQLGCKTPREVLKLRTTLMESLCPNDAVSMVDLLNGLTRST